MKFTSQINKAILLTKKLVKSNLGFRLKSIKLELKEIDLYWFICSYVHHFQPIIFKNLTILLLLRWFTLNWYYLQVIYWLGFNLSYFEILYRVALYIHFCSVVSHSHRSFLWGRFSVSLTNRWFLHFLSFHSSDYM